MPIGSTELHERAQRDTFLHLRAILPVHLVSVSRCSYDLVVCPALLHLSNCIQAHGLPDTVRAPQLYPGDGNRLPFHCTSCQALDEILLEEENHQHNRNRRRYGGRSS